MNALTSHLSTHCVGRYLIDMPADVLTFGSAKLQGVDFEAKPMMQRAYEQEMIDLDASLKATRSIFRYPFLFESGDGPTPGSRLFIHLKSDDQPGDSARFIEGYKWENGYRLKLKIAASDFTHSVMKDMPSVKKMKIQSDVPYKRQLVLNLLKQVRGRADTDIPTEPGVCFLGGFLPSKAGSEENLFQQFVLHDKHDVSFVLETDSDIQEDTTILERGAAINAAWKSTEGGRTVRKGKVDLPGMQAEEWLMAGRTELKVQGHSFRLEANSKTGSARTPLVGLDMDNGGASRALGDFYRIDKASLTEAETLALWDVVSRTLRPRPNGF